MSERKKSAKPAAGQSAADLEKRAEYIRQLVGEGAQLLAGRRPGEAVVRLEEAWALDPQNVAAAINLGGAYIMQGKHSRAVPVLEQAAQLEPQNAMIWTNLAAAYLGKLPFATRERQDKAIAAYEQVLKLDPFAPHTHYNLALIYMERNDRPAALAHFLRALETNPSDRDAQHYIEKLQRAGQDDAGSPGAGQPGDETI